MNCGSSIRNEATIEDWEAMMPEQVSGLYKNDETGEELRLDVDGDVPLMAASGTLKVGGPEPALIPWVANPIAKPMPGQLNRWSGSIVYPQDAGNELFPFTQVTIFLTDNTLRTKFEENNGNSIEREFNRKSRKFRQVVFEFDKVQGIEPVLSIDLDTLPLPRPQPPTGILTIEDVFNQVGFEVTRSRADTVVPLPATEPDDIWNDNELHDAMQVKSTGFSRFENVPQWAVWGLFAGRHRDGWNGLMFDSVGPNQRQGMAVFMKSFAADPSTIDPATRRMIFFTTAHEIGHTFNLAHSWEKLYKQEWTGISTGRDQLSFMNYPQDFEITRETRGSTEFFSRFEFRFTDEELLFLRHAPEQFVEPGNVAFMQDHGFRDASTHPDLQLRAGVNRLQQIYKYLEPVVVELTLSNNSQSPRTIPRYILSSPELMNIVIARRGGPIQRFEPFARACRKSETVQLEANGILRESLPISVGLGGWLIQDPGDYDIQVSLFLEDKELVSNRLSITVEPPSEQSERNLANDFFTDDVGRVLAFDGTRVLQTANDTLKRIVDSLPTHPVAVHARIALAMALIKPYKLLTLDQNKVQIDIKPAVEGSINVLAAALGLHGLALVPFAISIDHILPSITTLGFIAYRRYMNLLLGLLREGNDLLFIRPNTRLLLDEVDRVLNELRAR